MADALISPAVGGAMWATTAAATAYCAKRVREEADPAKVPLMGVTGAFIFAAQMLNFTIPGTGSSGHLGGGLILAILLGPYQAFLVIASVLTVQALFFADGGLLALGANIFNLGVFPAFIAYPLVYRRIAGDDPTTVRLAVASVLAAVVGLALGATGVVAQTTLSGVSELPFATFVTLMLPIHLAIGLVEGMVTAAVVAFVHKAQPEILARAATGSSMAGVRMRTVLAVLLAAAVLAGGVLSWFASANPDGLEWSIAGVTGSEEFSGNPSPVKDAASGVQEKTALFPDYALKSADPRDPAEEENGPAWPAVDRGTSLSGLLGGLMTLAIALVVGVLLNRRSKRGSTAQAG